MTTSAQKIRNVSLTESQSVRICKTSTNAFLSSIAYFRKIFPENRFRDVYWADGVQFPTLNYDKKEENKLSLRKVEDPNVTLFAKWLNEGVYEMIEKKYLKKLSLSISKANPDGTSVEHEPLQERYTLNYTYADDGQIFVNGKTKDKTMIFQQRGRKNESFDATNMTKEVKQMIRNIVGINATLKPLPEHILVSIEVEFTKNTPKDYKTRHFVRCNPEDITQFNNKKNVKRSNIEDEKTWRLNLGMLDTKHIALGLNIEVVEDDVEVKAVTDMLHEKREERKIKKSQHGAKTPLVNFYNNHDDSDDSKDEDDIFVTPTDMEIINQDDDDMSRRPVQEAHPNYIRELNTDSSDEGENSENSQQSYNSISSSSSNNSNTNEKKNNDEMFKTPTKRSSHSFNKTVKNNDNNSFEKNSMLQSSVEEAILLFNNRNTKTVSVSSLRALLKLEDMKSSSELCNALAKHGILKKKVNKNRSTSYIIEKESMAYNQMLKKIQRKKEVVSRKNDVLSNRKNKRNVNVGKDSSLVNAVNSKLAISSKDSRKINHGINSNISSEDDDVSITDCEDNNGNIEYGKKILKSQRKGNNLDESMKETNRKRNKRRRSDDKEVAINKKNRKKSYLARIENPIHVHSAKKSKTSHSGANSQKNNKRTSYKNRNIHNSRRRFSTNSFAYNNYNDDNESETF